MAVGLVRNEQAAESGEESLARETDVKESSTGDMMI